MKRPLVAVTVVLALGVFAAPLGGEAQPARKPPRIGVVFPTGAPTGRDRDVAAFEQGLRELGYAPGHTVTIEYRYAEDRADRAAALISELVRLNVNLLVVGAPFVAFAAKSSTQTIPIVFVGSGDPVGSGLVATLARPGGNVTGFSFAFEEGLGGKWVQLLKEAVPKVFRVAVLRAATTSPAYLRAMQSAVQTLGVRLQRLFVRSPEELTDAFDRMTRDRVQALIVDASPFFVTHVRQVVELSAKHRLPTMYPFRLFVDAGGLISYGASLTDLWRRAASHAHKILNGARPGELPVEQPTKFELVINLKTAETLGLTIPQSVLVRVDEVIH